MNDRRNPQSRSAALLRVLQYLQQARRGVRIQELQEPELRAGAAERILKRLALRGLVRVRNGRWAPRPVLLAATAINEPEAA